MQSLHAHRIEQPRPPRSNNEPPTDADVTLFGMWLGARTVPVSPRAGVKAALLPVEYVRCAEFRYVLSHLDVDSGSTVLDLGSPKMLSLFIAARMGARVHATDLLDYFFAEYLVYRERCGLSSHFYRLETQDARKLGYATGSLGRVFSVSVLEHIPDDGDSLAVKEIARVLEPGGLACVTVPYREQGHLDEYRPSYWGESFYQRAYDRQTLRSRLLEPSGLEIADLSFVGERWLAVEDAIINYKLPAPVRWAMYPLHLPLSRLFVRPLREDESSHKKVACVTLRKR